MPNLSGGLAISLAAALLLVGCGGGGSEHTGKTSAEVAPPGPSASTTDAASQAPAGSASATVSEPPLDVRRSDGAVGAAWVSPSGNISCWINPPKDGIEGDAGCYALAHTWVAPAPEEVCHASYGDMVGVTRSGAEFVCRGDIPSCFVASVDEPDQCGPGMAAGKSSKPAHWWHHDSDGVHSSTGGWGNEVVLPYNTAIRIGDFQCDSQEAGMTCRHLPTESGFTMSRATISIHGEGGASPAAGISPSATASRSVRCSALIAKGDLDAVAQLLMVAVNQRDTAGVADCVPGAGLRAKLTSSAAPRPLTKVAQCALSGDVYTEAIRCRASTADGRSLTFVFNSGSAGESLTDVTW